MSAREVEVATFLRTDATLVGLVSGGVYPFAWLSNVKGGLSNAEIMTKVWAGGVFRTSIIVRQGAAVPTGDLQSTRSKRTSMSQRIEVWVYDASHATIENVLKHVYRLLMGKRLTAAFSATQAGSGPGIAQAPELPSGIYTHHEDYRIVFLRRAITV